MQHTTKYQFNLIETSDTFSPEALNQNVQAAERELAALEKTAAKHKAELEAADSALAAALDSRVGIHGQTCRAATGTYKGNQSTHVSLTFDFRPMVLFVGVANTGNECHIMFRPFRGMIGLASSSHVVTWADRKITWSGTTANDTLNLSGTTYYYTVIGVED